MSEQNRNRADRIKRLFRLVAIPFVWLWKAFRAKWIANQYDGRDGNGYQPIGDGRRGEPPMRS